MTIFIIVIHWFAFDKMIKLSIPPPNDFILKINKSRLIIVFNNVVYLVLKLNSNFNLTSIIIVEIATWDICESIPMSEKSNVFLIMS